MTWWDIADLNELKAKGKLCVSCQGVKLLVIWHQEKVFAIENRCSHAGKPLDQGNITAEQIHCPYHGASFDLLTGNHLSPPAFRGIRVFGTRVIDDRIEIERQPEQT